jgi:hypothetical protein
MVKTDVLSVKSGTFYVDASPTSPGRRLHLIFTRGFHPYYLVDLGTGLFSGRADHKTLIGDGHGFRLFRDR